MTRELDDLSDAELIERAREGDSPAYGVLWKRHWNAGRAMAASVTGRFEPDDLASEAFARILKSIEKGSGPRSGFRSYLATTVRNVAIDWSRRKVTPNIEDPDVVEDWTYSELTALDRIERETVADAFYALPESWQEVLWYTVVEDMQPREVAPLLGLTPNAVSALSARAREGLRQAWITAHLAECDTKDPAHKWTVAKLGSYVRGRLSRADHRRVVQHLEQCESCTNAATEADHVGSRLALGLLPLFLGVSGAVAYSAWTSGQSGSAVAATLPANAANAANAAAGRSGRLRHLLQSAASGSSLGVTTVAASVITAVALTTAVTGSAGRDIPAASAESRQEPTDAREGRIPVGEARGDEAAGDEAPEGAAQPPELVDPSGDAGQEDGGGAAVSPDPVDEGDGEQAARPSDSTRPTTPAEPPAVAGPAQPTPSSPSGCEAAVRAVPADDTVFAYRLDEADDATTAIDFVHGVGARYEQSRSTPGWSLSDGVLRPATDVFTVQVWFKADSGGGRLLGYSSDVRGTSWAYDRHLFLTDDGRVVFGVFPGGVRTISSSASFTDGRWHQATASLSGAGMALYVDGQRVAADPTVTRAQNFAGYWRVGADNLDNWGAETPSTRAFPGALAFAAVYRTALTAEQVRTQWDLCQ